MPAPGDVVDLVERFRQVAESGDYNEAQLRQEFIDPFFKALGWDVANERGVAETYKDVIHEAAIKVGGGTKAPDYCFRVGATRRFFVEAKRPAVDIAEDPEPAYQLRRYAWSAKLPMSILTTFGQFAVHDCRVKPKPTDSPAVARILLVPYGDYVSRWDELAAIFSHDAVLKGQYDRYLAGPKPRGTVEIDDAFLAEIEEWRDALARNIALRNPSLGQSELNFAVQATVDRIVFLRICEDRGIEPYGRLQALLNGERVYRRLFELFERADERYNSGLFHFHKEKSRPEAPDALTPSLDVDDGTLKDILRRLYYPESPYEFSLIPADILGQVYERFLGKLIRLTAGHRAVVEEKPEVRKAGGVYYTPTHIVDYVVRCTVGRLLTRKTPRRAAQLRVLDPACGSGSFLLGAYQHLLDWHLEWYRSHDPEKWSRGRNPVVCRSAGGDWRLTTAERKRILLNNIYGVDIDPQAVEVTRLSLLLKVLEGESGEAIRKQFELFRERALPDLASNIKCGNSLVGQDFYNNHQMGLFDHEELLRINAFDWKDGFPQVMAAGGFDAVIGNPPYVRIQALSEFRPPAEIAYYKKHYRTASRGNYDLYALFLERVIQLLNGSGRVGYIVPNKFLTTDSGQTLRGLLSELRAVDGIVDFGHEQVFSRSTTYTCLLFLDRSQPDSFVYVRTHPEELSELREPSKRVPAEALGSAPWVLVPRASHRLLAKLKKHSVPLLQLPVAFSRGVSTGADDVFVLKRIGRRLTDGAGEPVDVERAILRRTLCATDFTRYQFRPREEQFVIFPYRVTADGYEIIPEGELRERYPNAYEYLRANKKRLAARKQRREWYGFSAPRNLHLHDRAALIVPLLCDCGLCAPMPVPQTRWCVMASAGFTIALPQNAPKADPRYLLGLLNSKLLFWNLRQISNKFRGGWVTCTKQFFGKLPIRQPEDAAGQTRRARLEHLVDSMMESLARQAVVKTPHEQEAVQRRIGTTDQQIDRLVYELYGLTDEEIRIVQE
ncbi:MAG: restriction endonuclease subunit M [Planctomycetes bacterium]|nr:restriction endonuclease subunit M [Planctomycetota bacterium]